MKIKEIRVHLLQKKLSSSMRISRGGFDVRHHLIVEVITDEGILGLGEGVGLKWISLRFFSISLRLHSDVILAFLWLAPVSLASTSTSLQFHVAYHEITLDSLPFHLELAWISL